MYTDLSYTEATAATTETVVLGVAPQKTYVYYFEFYIFCLMTSILIPLCKGI